MPGDSLVRAGAAWYEIHPTLKGQLMGRATITDQGYVFSQGNYLLYPAVVAARDGNAAMDMTLMGPGTFASAVYATRTASTGHTYFVMVTVLLSHRSHDIHVLSLTSPPETHSDQSSSAKPARAEGHGARDIRVDDGRVH